MTRRLSAGKSVFLTFLLCVSVVFVCPLKSGAEPPGKAQENDPRPAQPDDDDNRLRPTVTMSGATSVNEGSAGTMSVTVTRTGLEILPLTVRYSVGGTASSEEDYSPLSGSVVIPAGEQSASIPLQWINDSLPESNETIVLTLRSNAAYEVGPEDIAVLTIIDNDAEVTVQPSSPSTSEGAGSSSFVIRRSMVTRTDLSVRFTLSGTAVNGTDYSAISPPVSIPANASSITIPVNALMDNIVEPDETVVLTLQTGGAPDYVVGTPGNATITILGVPTVTIAATDPNASEAGTDRGTFTFSRSGSTASPLTVTYTISGTAIRGTDYNTAPAAGTVTIPSGSLSATVSVIPVDDSAFEGDETVIFTIAGSNAYRAGSPGSATITLRDNDEAPRVTIAVTSAPLFPTQNATVAVQLGTPASTQLDGALTISFSPGAGVPSGYRDPALQFVSGGPTLNFVVPPQAMTATLPQGGAMQQGTVAGDITVTLTRLAAGGVNALPQQAPSRTITIPRLPPVITGVRILNAAANSFDVEVTAYSTPRDMTTATFTFGAAPGTSIAGAETFTFDVRSVVNQWYASAESLMFGSLLRMRVRFTIEGDARLLQRVTAVLANSVGNSTPATGTR
jgi:hypothetical protein